MRIEMRANVAILRLEAPKAGAIGPAFLEEIEPLLNELDTAAPAAEVWIGQGRAFSAGLDIPSLLDLDRAAMKGFMDRFNAVMQRLFEVPRPTVAAVNGHAIAGGCVVAMQADRRIMAGAEAGMEQRGPRIGLNETALGIGLPTIVLESFRSQVSSLAFRRSAMGGELLTADEALDLGMVDEVVAPEVVEARALVVADELAESVGPAAYAQVKAVARRPYLERVRAHGYDDTERWLDTWFDPDAQQRLHSVKARLSKGADRSAKGP